MIFTCLTLMIAYTYVESVHYTIVQYVAELVRTIL